MQYIEPEVVSEDVISPEANTAYLTTILYNIVVRYAV